MNSMVQEILKNKKSVREIIDEAVSVNELQNTSIEMEPETSETPVADVPEDDGKYVHLFVRRWKKGADKPYKRSKVTSAIEALNLYFSWLEEYKHDKVEIWSENATDAKNFYRFVLKNRELVEDMWKSSPRTKRAGNLWPAAYKDIQTRARQSGTNLVGTFYPFNQDVNFSLPKLTL